jgi:hypothetical protein
LIWFKHLGSELLRLRFSLRITLHLSPEEPARYFSTAWYLPFGSWPSDESPHDGVDDEPRCKDDNKSDDGVGEATFCFVHGVAVTARGHQTKASIRNDDSEEDKEETDEPLDETVGEVDDIAGGTVRARATGEGGEVLGLGNRVK